MIVNLRSLMCWPLPPHIVYQCNSHWIDLQDFKFPILPHCVCPLPSSVPRQNSVVSVFVHCSVPFSGDVHCETQPGHFVLQVIL